MQDVTTVQALADTARRDPKRRRSEEPDDRKADADRKDARDGTPKDHHDRGRGTCVRDITCVCACGYSFACETVCPSHRGCV